MTSLQLQLYPGFVTRNMTTAELQVESMPNNKGNSYRNKTPETKWLYSSCLGFL